MMKILMTVIWNQISTFIEFISLTRWMFSFFLMFSTAFYQRYWLDQIILRVPWIPTGSLSTYQLSIMDQFHKIANCKHFYSLCSFFISQKINSCVFSSTFRWPIYIVIPETVCLEFMLATFQQCWTFPNSFFFFFFCLQAGRKHYSFWLTCLSKIFN